MENETYERETMNHVTSVRAYMERAGSNIFQRAHLHDASKFEEPEASGFQRIAALSECQDIEYGSEEYKARLAAEKPTIDHHYQENDHHPEHWLTHDAAMSSWSAVESDPVKNGKCVSSMSALAQIEMLCDWKAASVRYKNGSFAGSWKTNMAKFGIGSQLESVLWNTAVELGLMTQDGQDV